MQYPYDEHNCNFCGKNHLEVWKLVVGPSVNICNECIDECNQIIQESEPIKEDKPDQRLWPHRVETKDNARWAYYSMTAIPSKVWKERFYKNWRLSIKYMVLKPEVRFDGKMLIVITPGNRSSVYHIALDHCIQKTNEPGKSAANADD